MDRGVFIGMIVAICFCVVVITISGTVIGYLKYQSNQRENAFYAKMSTQLQQGLL
jgi:lipopolysaccharide export LptBFGC system permease protein LptF